MASEYPTTKTKGFLYINSMSCAVKNRLEQLVGSRYISFRGILEQLAMLVYHRVLMAETRLT